MLNSYSIIRLRNYGQEQNWRLVYATEGFINFISSFTSDIFQDIPKNFNKKKIIEVLVGLHSSECSAFFDSNVACHKNELTLEITLCHIMLKYFLSLCSMKIHGSDNRGNTVLDSYLYLYGRCSL